MASLAFLLCALPLLAQNSQRRVVATCELTTASVIPSGKKTDAQGREFAIRVVNNSTRPIALPRSPIFSWRVDTLHKKEWRFKAEGGPVRRLSATDPHIVVTGNPESLPMQEIAPEDSADFYTFLPDAESALQPVGQRAVLKLTIYWAASTALSQSNPSVPPCALAPEWIVSLQKSPSRR